MQRTHISSVDRLDQPHPFKVLIRPGQGYKENEYSQVLSKVFLQNGRSTEHVPKCINDVSALILQDRLFYPLNVLNSDKLFF